MSKKKNAIVKLVTKKAVGKKTTSAIQAGSTQPTAEDVLDLVDVVAANYCDCHAGSALRCLDKKLLELAMQEADETVGGFITEALGRKEVGS